MKKLILTPAIAPALVALAALSACSSGGEAPAADGAETTGEVANADNDTAEPEAEAHEGDDHPHGEDEGEHSH